MTATQTRQIGSEEFPRTFVAPDVRFDEWAAAEPYYQQLVDRKVNSLAEFEQWLRDFSELDAAFDEEGTARHIAMTCATDDAEREQAFLHYVENVQPHREPLAQRLRLKLADLASRYPLPKQRYEVLERSVRSAIEIFREENIPLHVELARMSQQYQKITGGMTVTLRGEELTIQQAARNLEEPDRALREEAWRAIADRFMQNADELNKLYADMVRVRHQTAKNADCVDFREYMFKAMQRFDYTPDDCLAFHDAIEKVCVPAVGRLLEQRREKLGLKSLRPWDLDVDLDQRPPLRPFKTDEELIAGCSKIFHKVDDELGDIFDGLSERGLLDLGSRKGKAPGGYQATYNEKRLPFIFMNAVGTESDVRTLLHEGGHAFHTWSCRNDPLDAYRTYPIEFAEVASMGMEMLCLPHVDVFYGSETDRARKRFLEGIVMFFPFMARVDAFQHWVYTHVDATTAERQAQWQALTKRFSPHVDWTGIEHYDRNAWHRKLHIFEVPFYYVEYGIAQLGALQVWQNSKRAVEDAVAKYRYGLSLGGSRPLPELFEAAGLKFDFSEKTLAPLIEGVLAEIGA